MICVCGRASTEAEAELIAAGLSPLNPEREQLAASKLYLAEIVTVLWFEAEIVTVLWFAGSNERRGLVVGIMVRFFLAHQN